MHTEKLPVQLTDGEMKIVAEELGELPDPETVVAEATEDDPGDEQYDASHANATKRLRKRKAPDSEEVSA